MRKGERGAVASARVEEQPTAAAHLQILLLADTGEGSDQDRMRGRISALWAPLRRAILGPRAAQSRH
jgi:hypothetical protein